MHTLPAFLSPSSTDSLHFHTVFWSQHFELLQHASMPMHPSSPHKHHSSFSPRPHFCRPQPSLPSRLESMVCQEPVVCISLMYENIPTVFSELVDAFTSIMFPTLRRCLVFSSWSDEVCVCGRRRGEGKGHSTGKVGVDRVRGQGRVISLLASTSCSSPTSRPRGRPFAAWR